MARRSRAKSVVNLTASAIRKEMDLCLNFCEFHEETIYSKFSEQIMEAAIMRNALDIPRVDFVNALITPSQVPDNVVDLAKFGWKSFLIEMTGIRAQIGSEEGLLDIIIEYLVNGSHYPINFGTILNLERPMPSFSSAFAGKSGDSREKPIIYDGPSIPETLESVLPVSRYNPAYFCQIWGLTLANQLITIHIDERGDMSLGGLQSPRSSKLTHARSSCPLVYESFHVQSMSYRIIGKLTFAVPEDLWYDLIDHAKKGDIDFLLKFQFEFGSSGYGSTSIVPKSEVASGGQDGDTKCLDRVLEVLSQF